MIIDRDGQEVHLTLKGRYMNETPAQMYGPPEDCYEGEPATVDIMTVVDDNGQRVELSVDEEETAVERLLDAGADDGAFDDDDFDTDMDPPEPNDDDAFDEDYP